MKAQQKASYPHGQVVENTEPLIKLVTQWKNKEATMDEVVREFYRCERVRKIAKHVTRDAGFDTSVDEAVQLVADRFFTEGIMDGIYDEKNLYSLIYRVAENAIRQEAESNLRWEKKHALVHEDGPKIEDMRAVEDFSGEVLRKINRERSSAELMRRIDLQRKKEQVMEGYSLTNPMALPQNGIEIAAGKQAVGRAKKVSKPAAKEAKELSGAAVELREIRKRLGYRVDDFARAINVSRDKVSAALYGRMNPVNEDIMQAARGLLDNSMAEIRAREAKFKRFANMDALVCFWLEELDLEDNRKGEEELAVILGIYHSTLFRWRKDAYKPQIADLERYDQNVRNSVEHRKMLREMNNKAGVVHPTGTVKKRKTGSSRKSASSS